MAVHTIFDFGMHRGEDTQFYLATGASVVAFEANPELVKACRSRFDAEIRTGQLTIIEGAIVPPGHADGPVVFFVDESKSVWGTTNDEWVKRNQTLGSTISRIEVPAVDLETVLESRPTPYFAKIDIEGADRDVLATLARCGRAPQFISMESSKQSLEDVIEEIRQLQDMGYTRFAAVQQATIPGREIVVQSGDDRSFLYRFERHASGPFGPYLQDGFKSAEAVIEDYRRIFRRYRLFGDASWFMRNPIARPATRLLNWLLTRLLGAPLCGWYDTHAAR
jgi:FkbM family methyltransferase